MRANRVTSWQNDLLEKLEDGQGLNVVLPVALRASKSDSTSAKKRPALGESKNTVQPEKAKTEASSDSNTNAVHSNSKVIAAWQLPNGVKYLDLFGAKDARPQGMTSALQHTPLKEAKSNPTGPHVCQISNGRQCKQGCSLALVVASAMMDEARAKASTLFQAIYSSS
jgi:hypothetical protein